MNWNTYPPILAPFLTLQYEQQNATHKEVVWSHDHGWIWPGDARSQPITRHDIDLVCENITYPASRGLTLYWSQISAGYCPRAFYWLGLSGPQWILLFWPNYPNCSRVWNINDQKTLYLIQYILDHLETFRKSSIQYTNAFSQISWCYDYYEGSYGNLI